MASEAWSMENRETEMDLRRNVGNIDFWMLRFEPWACRNGPWLVD
jgi:hypothetical protein